MKLFSITSFIMIVMVILLVLSSCSTKIKPSEGNVIYISLSDITYRNIVMDESDSTIHFTNRNQDFAFRGKVTAINTEVVDGELYYRGFYVIINPN